MHDPLDRCLDDSESKSSSDAGCDESNADTASSNEGGYSRLTWRADPTASYSDWTIEVHVTTNVHTPSAKLPSRSSKRISAKRAKLATPEDQRTKSKTYHVHKFVLGPRSNYFANLFQTKIPTIERQSGVSTIHLESSAADAFPVFLDLIYTSSDDEEWENVEASNSVALRYLASYFGVQNIYTHVSEFIRKNISANNVATYLSEAALYNDDKIVDIAVRRCAERLHTNEPRLVAKYSQGFFEKVLSSPHLNVSSEKLSAHFAAYGKSNPAFYDSDTFTCWTVPEKMPQISPKAAVSFLSPNRDFPNGLHERCSDICSKSWEALNEEDYSSLPSTRQENIRHKSLAEAKSDMSSLRKLCLALIQGSDSYNARRILSQERFHSAILKTFQGAVSVPPVVTPSDDDNVEQFPDVSITGAGFVVNGTYKAIGSKNGSGVYSNGTFFLVRGDAIDEYKAYWYILSRYLEDAGIKQIKFYRATELESDVLPTRGWNSISSCYDPPPSLSTIAEEGRPEHIEHVLADVISDSEDSME